MGARDDDELAAFRGKRVTKSKPMPEHVKRELAERRRRQAELEEAARLERMRQQADAGAWRRARLRRYVDRVLERSGIERLEYFDQHPISELFR